MCTGVSKEDQRTDEAPAHHKHKRLDKKCVQVNPGSVSSGGEKVRRGNKPSLELLKTRRVGTIPHPFPSTLQIKQR